MPSQHISSPRASLSTPRPQPPRRPQRPLLGHAPQGGGVEAKIKAVFRKAKSAQEQQQKRDKQEGGKKKKKKKVAAVPGSAK